MFSRLFSDNKPKSEDWEKLLAQARRLLWRDKLRDAHRLFDHIRSDIEKQINGIKTSPENLSLVHLQARLGIWAINYLENPGFRREIVDLLDTKKLDLDTAYFVAKVFQSRNDVSPEALNAYKALLQLNKSHGLAKRISELLKNSAFSQQAIELLAVIVNILPEDYQLAGRLCRWYMRASQIDKATDTAYRILLHDPSNREANRCLGVVAEQNKDWETALRHYRLSHDYLRACIMLSKDGRFSEAQQLLAHVSEELQIDTNWLYYHGWISANNGDFPAALTSWGTLQRNTSNGRKALAYSIQAVREHMLYDRLVSFQDFSNAQLDEAQGTPYYPLSALQAGASKLLLEDDIDGGLHLLRKAAELRSDDVYAATFLKLAKAIQEDNEQVDGEVYRELALRFHDGSLFMWLRGLWLLLQGRSRGFKYLQKAFKDGVADRHVSQQAVAIANWLSMRVTGDNTSDISQGAIEVFQWNGSFDANTVDVFRYAIMPSYTLHCMEKGHAVSWIDMPAAHPLDRATWNRVQTIYQVHRDDWKSAVHALDGCDKRLVNEVVSAAIQSAISCKDWNSVAEYVSIGLSFEPEHVIWKRIERQVRSHTFQLLWRKGEYEALDFELEELLRSGSASTSIYHALATIYTQLAIAKDRKAEDYEGDDPQAAFSIDGHRTQSEYTGILEDQPHNDYWQLAVGYWAVALTDEEYWKGWAERRGGIYRETILSIQLRELTHQTIPQMLRRYHEEEIHKGSIFATHHRYYVAILNREIELTTAMRYLLRSAQQKPFTFGLAPRLFISPLLMKEYGHEAQGVDIVGQISKLRLSPYEVNLLQKAFSPLSDVEALISINEYDLALHTLHKMLENNKYKHLSDEILEELCRVLDLSAHQAIELEKWDQAIALATEGLERCPLSEQFEILTASALVGWANQKIRDENYAEATKKLEAARLTLKHQHTDLLNLLSEAYVEWGGEAIQDDDTETAIVRFEKALSVYPSNDRAKEQLNIVYHNSALSHARRGRYTNALIDVNKALDYTPDDLQTTQLKVQLHYDAAQNAEKSKDIAAARRYWTIALETARRCWTLEQSHDVLKLGVSIKHDYMLFLVRSNSFTEAVAIGEELLQADYDRSVLDVNMAKILSAIYGDYGAYLYNTGNQWLAKQMTQKALKYDPSNHVARNNLRRM